MGRVLAAFATLLILILAAAFIAPLFIDWAAYRPMIESAASQAVGRTVRTKGAIGLSLLPEPRLKLENIEMLTTQAGEPAIAVQSADIALSLPALLGGQVEASSVKLIHPVVKLDLTETRTPPSAQPALAATLLRSAEIRALEIVDGSLVVLSRNASAQTLALSRINGSVAFPPGAPIRFTGRGQRDERTLDLKIGITPGVSQTTKVTANILDLATKSSLQLDGTLFTVSEPIFEGALSVLFTPKTMSSDQRIDVSAKATARIEADGAALANVILTVDSQNRPQIVTGSAQIDFASQNVSAALEAASLDVDALISAGAAPDRDNAQTDWPSYREVAEQILWFAPKSAVRLSLATEQMQIKGEPLTKVAVDAARTADRWVFEKVTAVLPGDATVKGIGTIKKTETAPTLSATGSIEGKSLGRFVRWIAPTSVQARQAASQPFVLKASVTLSEDATIMEGASGVIGKTPFEVSLRVEKTPTPKMIASLSGEAIDLSSIDFAMPDGGLRSVDVSKLAKEATLSALAPALSEIFGPLAEADISVSARSLRLNTLELRNIGGRVRLSPLMVSISKLNIETAEGLTISGDGSVPIVGTQDGRIEGRMEAPSAGAFREALRFTGIGTERLGGRSIDDLVPAKISVSYTTDVSGERRVKADGAMGDTRVSGQGQFKAANSDSEPMTLAASFDANSPNGARFAHLLLNGANTDESSSSAPGTLKGRFSGSLQKLDTSIMLTTPAVQAQFDGVTEYKSGNLTSLGKVTASSPNADAFLPRDLLVLLGAEPKSKLKVSATVALDDTVVTADRMEAESPRNLVTGKIEVDTAATPFRIEADLKADRYDLGALLAPILTSSRAQATDSEATTAPATSMVWTNKPFSQASLQTGFARLSLAAKTMTVMDGIVLTSAQASATLQNGKLDLIRLDGKVFGGDVMASGTSVIQSGAVMVNGRLSITGLDLAAVPSSGKSLASGKVAILLNASGRALSPQGLISVLNGRGTIGLSDGVIRRLSPLAVQKTADDLAGLQPVPSDDTIAKRLNDAAQTTDYRFRRVRIPVLIHDGLLEIRRAAFTSQRDGQMRLEAMVDLARLQVDATWQLGSIRDPRAKWPPVKVTAAGSIRDLGNLSLTFAADDLVRGLAARRMEADLKRLESLNNRPAPTAPWTTKQETVPRSDQRRPEASATPSGEAEKPVAAPPPSSYARPSFETRMRELLQSEGGNARLDARP